MEKNRIKALLPFALSFVGAVLSFAVTIVLTNFLGKENYGQIQYWIGIITSFASFSAFGMPSFITRDYHKYENKKSFLTTTLFIVLIFNIIVFPIMFLISYFLCTELNKNIVLIIFIILCSITSSIMLMLQYFYICEQKKNISIIVGTVGIKLLLLIVSAVLAIFTIQGVFPQYFVYIYFAIFLVVIIPPIIRNFDHKLIRFEKTQFTSLLIFMLISTLGGINTQISKVILGEAGEGSYSAVAVYSVCIQILLVLTAFVSLISSFARPKFAEAIANNDHKSLNEVYSSSLRLTTRIAIPFYVGVVIQQSTLLSLFGEGFVGYPLIMILLVAAQFISELGAQCGSILSMGKKESRELIINAVQFILFVGISLLLVKKIYFAIPLAMLVSYLFVCVTRFILVYKYYKIVPIDLVTLLQMLFEVVTSIVVFVLINLIKIVYLKLALDCIFGVGLITLYLLLPKFKEDTNKFFEKC